MLRFLYHTKKSFSLVFWEEEWLVGGDPFYLKFWVNRLRWSEIADFQPILDRSASAVTPSEKSSVNTNRKSPTRFPTSLRWSSYVPLISPKSGSKTQNGWFFTALHGMQTRSCDEISVCPSVCSSVRLSNACIVTKRKKNLSRFLYHAKEHSV